MVWKDHVHNYVSCHLPHIDGKGTPSLTLMVPIGLKYMLCGSPKGGSTCWYVIDVARFGTSQHGMFDAIP